MGIILLVIVLLLLFGGGGYRLGGLNGSGIGLGSILVVLLVLYLLGFFR